VQGDDDMLEQAESLDSDEVRNDDGDQVVDPPQQWIEAEDNTSLDDKLAAEVPDGLPPRVGEDLADVVPAGKDGGQVDGTPEDGDSFFDVVTT
jgi:hypothetical protein